MSERDKIRELWNSEIDELLNQEPKERNKDKMTWINAAGEYILSKQVRTEESPDTPPEDLGY